jgi:hypothetical protein
LIFLSSQFQLHNAVLITYLIARVIFSILWYSERPAVIITDILDSDHLLIMLIILDSVTTRKVLDPVEN